MICNSGIDNAILKAKANHLTTIQPLQFNGDDAVILLKGDQRIDIVGHETRIEFAKDTILTRKSNIYAPVTTYDPEEWESKAWSAEDTFDTLGSHTLE